MELIKGHRANPTMMKQLGFKRLSTSQWVSGKIKVQIIRGRIFNIQNQTNFNQPIFTFSARNAKHSIIAREMVKMLLEPSPLYGLCLK